MCFVEIKLIKFYLKDRSDVNMRRGLLMFNKYPCENQFLVCSIWLVSTLELMYTFLGSMLFISKALHENYM